ncbi:MAG: flagellar biosynthesis anti-sigma factor FlgM [Alteraurantiacibacter sp.]|nr:flagellar biosynthesis anti-sigma factor FlgM [Alteraurantiacibacter sp.]
MALYDISRLNGPAAVRPLGRGNAAEQTSGKAGAKPTDAPAVRVDTLADRGIAVETGVRIEAGSMPVDHDRVAEIRAALRDGSYPIVPTRISDAIIAARLMLSNPR